MDTRTHNLIAKRLLYNVPEHLIEDINYAIDNPDRGDILLANRFTSPQMRASSFYYNPYDPLELGKRSSHRRVNHDLISSAYTGYRIAGPDGMRAGVLHYLIDGMSDDVKKRYGARYRDLWQAAYAYSATR